MVRTASVKSNASVTERPEPGASLRDETRAIFRAAVLDAAEAEFAQCGFEAARMQDVARRARVAVGTVYNHFANKDDLLDALLTERGSGLLGAFARREDDPTDFEAQFLARFSRMQAHLARHRAFFAVMMQSGVLGIDEHRPGTFRPPESSMQLEKRMAQEVRELLATGMAEGALSEDDPVRLARFLKGAMRTVMIESIADGVTDIQAQGAWVLEQFLRGARARPAQTAGGSPLPDAPTGRSRGKR